MANSKISTLTNSLTKATAATNDILPIVDTSATETKKMTYGEAMSPIDSVFRIAGSSDNTKLVAFEVDGLTTATTRTLTVPDANTTLVGTDTTQTLTNKTLTSPQINFGSDANGDLIYRNGSGVTARLAIGSTDQILAVQSGLPTWIANPSATAASATVAGIVELATTAETETGTDATRAVTPDGLHDMTTLAGAAWFLDEDTMSSDSAIKTASQQSIKAYVDASVTPKNGVFQQNANSSTTTTIAHGLGRTPKMFKIYGLGSTGNADVNSIGSYNGTNNRSIHKWYDSNGGTSGTNTDTTAAVWISYGSSTGSGQTLYIKGVVTWDATNVTITWTVGGAGNSSLTISYEWEAV